MDLGPKKKIAIVTGNRAEFGLLAPVMRAIDAHPRLRLQVVVTGLHLVRGTWRDVTAAGFRIAAKVPMQRAASPRSSRSSRAADVESLGRGVIHMGRAFQTLQPDVVLVLGDRIEPLAAACAAAVGGILLAHVHGGDRAEGVADESMRHAISKLAHLHFAATAQSRARLIRMGEEKSRVWNVGSPSIDGLRGIQPAADAPDLIIVQHPIGAPDEQEYRWMKATLRATRSYRRLLMAPNGDPGSAGIARALSETGQPVLDHLPRRRFAELVAGCRAVVGNTSAGLIEVAALRTPCVNIGPRQGGRQRPQSVIDCDYGQANVRTALRQALSLNRAKLPPHPYGPGHASARIAQILASLDLHTLSVRKQNAY